MTFQLKQSSVIGHQWPVWPKTDYLITNDFFSGIRGRIIGQIGDLVLEELEAIDNGKPLAFARVADVPLTADLLHYMAGWPTKIAGNTIPISDPYSPGGQFRAFTQTRTDVKIVQEEIFGPVVAIEAFENVEDLVLHVNDTTYGLA